MNNPSGFHIQFFCYIAKAFLLLAFLLSSFAFYTFSTSEVLAAINETINFQAKVVNPDGTNPAPACGTSCDFRFKLFDAASGGTELWTEDQSNVTLSDGVINVKLGSVSTLSGVDFNSDSIYLEIQFDADDDATYEEIFDTPRLQFSAVPYAFNAQSIDGRSSTDFISSNTSDTYEGGESNQLVIESDLTNSDRTATLLDVLQQNDATNLMSGDFVTIRQLDADSTGDAIRVTNEGNGDTLRLDDENADTSPFVVDSAGNVGIGKDTPVAKLDVTNNTGTNDIATFYDDTTEVFAIEDGGNVDFNLNESLNFRIENIDGSGGIPTCDVNGIGRQYYDTSDDNIYACIETSPSVYAWVALNTVGSGTEDLDSVYDFDADKVMEVDNALGLEFRETAGGNISFDLQSTGDFVLQDSDVTFLTISDDGSYDYTLDVLDNPTYTITNLGTGSFVVNDENADTTPFSIDQFGNVGIGATGQTAKLEVTSADQNSVRINPFGTNAGETGGLQFMELAANGTNYIGFQAPDSIAANLLWTLPNTDGGTGEVLFTDGSGNLDWKLINSLEDADADTKIQVEENTDEDTIRFDTGGFERMSIDSNGDVNIGITTTPILTEGFETAVPPAGAWTTGGDLNWVQDATDFTEGANSAASDAALIDDQDTWIDLDVTLAQDGKVTFDWRSDSETGFDFLIFCLDNDVACDVTAGGPVGQTEAISGNTAWANVEVALPAGSRSLRWLYGKDGSVTTGSDRGWIDNIIVSEGSSTGTANLFIAGNIGIGTDTPATELHVEGDARITNLASCDLISTDADGDLQCETNSGAVFDAYDGAGGQNFNTPIVVNIDTTRQIDANYTLTTDTVDIGSDGTYEITYTCGLENGTNGRTSGRCFLEADTGGGFAEVVGSDCYTYNRNNANDEGSCSRTVVLDLATTNDIRLGADSQSGQALVTLQNGSSLTIRKLIAPGADLAEIYYTKDNSIEAGDVVVVDGSIYAGVKKNDMEYQPSLLGVISTQPGQVIGYEENIEKEGRAVLVALSGRVPTKIDPDSEKIEAGDYLTSSPREGYAMKATKPGAVIGKALESWDPEGDGQQNDTIQVFISAATYNPNDGIVHKGLQTFIDNDGKGVDIGTETERFNNVYATNVDADSFQTSNYNMSEIYKAIDSALSAGDVVAPYFGEDLETDPEDPRMVIQKSEIAYQDNVLGVISTSPGVTLSEWAETSEEETTDDLSRPVALVGRVPVKVSTENGDVVAGDKLVPASTPGYAMKACGDKYCQPGLSIGVALEGFSENESGDSAEVEEKIEEVVDELVNEITDKKDELEENLADAADSETIENLEEEIEIIDELTEAVDDITETLEESERGLGRVMMFVNLTYFNGNNGNQFVDTEGETSTRSSLDFLQGSVAHSNIQGGAHGFLYVEELRVKGDATFESDVYVEGKTYLGADSVGLAEIAKGDLEVDVEFDEEYPKEPIITITPIDYYGEFKLTDVTNLGFTIKLKSSSSRDILFNWHAFGSLNGLSVQSSRGTENERNENDNNDDSDEEIIIKLNEPRQDNDFGNTSSREVVSDEISKSSSNETDEAELGADLEAEIETETESFDENETQETNETENSEDEINSESENVEKEVEEEKTKKKTEPSEKEE